MLNSLYIHIPFCNHRCGYCDFNTYAGLQRLIPDYTSAVCAEIRFLSRSAQQRIKIHTIYFGGGTPSLVPEQDLEKILTGVHDEFDLVTGAETTIEANPGTVSEAYLRNIQALGVNRISLGMQSADQNELDLLERQHSFVDVVRSVEWARKAGIKNLNLDLIFGLPDQLLKVWLNSLDAALSLQPEHLSLYALTLEQGTPMHKKVALGILPEPDPDTAADMYELATEVLARAGYIQYEISNWARMDTDGRLFSCQHNLQYWRNSPYIGIGAGAHGYIGGYRTVDVSIPGLYIKKMTKERDSVQGDFQFPSTPATIEKTPIDTETEIGETMMMGLRLLSEGVSSIEFQQRFGISLRERFSVEIDRLVLLGLLEWAGENEERLHLTSHGRLLGNQVFREFI
jgi:oxygen-independent coproporphyrinogen-3 oxidase